MKKKFSPTWNRSVQPRKQRKYRHNAPLHLKQKFMHAHLSPELRKKYLTRNIQLKTGDKVKVLRGVSRKKEGRVERINLKKERVFITGIEKIKKEGTKLLVALRPSNLMIIELNLDDKKRKQKLESKQKETPKTEEKKEEKKLSSENEKGLEKLKTSQRETPKEKVEEKKK
jgi:large subunit ribosomal protein L24